MFARTGRARRQNGVDYRRDIEWFFAVACILDGVQTDFIGSHRIFAAEVKGAVFGMYLRVCDD
jgi:hypothetical protein